MPKNIQGQRPPWQTKGFPSRASEEGKGACSRLQATALTLTAHTGYSEHYLLLVPHLTILCADWHHLQNVFACVGLGILCPSHFIAGPRAQLGTSCLQRRSLCTGLWGISEEISQPHPHEGSRGRKPGLCSCGTYILGWLFAAQAWAMGRHQKAPQKIWSHFTALCLSQLVISKTRWFPYVLEHLYKKIVLCTIFLDYKTHFRPPTVGGKCGCVL